MGGGRGDVVPLVSALDSVSSVPGSSPGWCHCVVFLGEAHLKLSQCLSPLLAYLKFSIYCSLLLSYLSRD